MTGPPRPAPLSASAGPRAPGRRPAWPAVRAAVEVGCRLAQARVPRQWPLEPSPRRLAEYLALRYGTDHQEVLGAVFTTRRGAFLGDTLLYRGTLNRCCAEPRAILTAALQHDAGGVIVFHTYPSGDPSPSAEDLGFTTRMADACTLLGITFLDHLIVAPGGTWVSLRGSGGW